MKYLITDKALYKQIKNLYEKFEKAKGTRTSLIENNDN